MLNLEHPQLVMNDSFTFMNTLIYVVIYNIEYLLH